MLTGREKKEVVESLDGKFVPDGLEEGATLKAMGVKTAGRSTGGRGGFLSELEPV